ncbi:MAG: hypothetical protein ACI4J0_03755 [Huintestinicola sp.]|uniref:hypothetical protein n=1 Tax=Huintestinicola sp. TaxID=2981661 RepID=UPI003F0682F7
MVKYHIAESEKSVSLNLAVADIFRTRPELFRDDIRIASFFGSPAVMWNGGRMLLGPYNLNKTKAILDGYNSRGIPYRFTFTNPCLTEESLKDKDCNELLNVADNGINEVIVNSPLLEDHIRKTHPNMKITSSTCKCITDIDELKAELAKPYSLVVADFNFNNNFELLEKLTPEERKRCELLINAHCVPGCPRRKEHYQYIGEVMLRVDEIRKMTNEERARAGIEEWECKYRAFNPFSETKTKLEIAPDDVTGKYAEMGFENFKIEGRATNIMILCEQIVQYMAKPEKKDELRYALMISAIEFIYLNF